MDGVEPRFRGSEPGVATPRPPQRYLGAMRQAGTPVRERGPAPRPRTTVSVPRQPRLPGRSPYGAPATVTGRTTSVSSATGEDAAAGMDRRYAGDGGSLREEFTLPRRAARLRSQRQASGGGVIKGPLGRMLRHPAPGPAECRVQGGFGLRDSLKVGGWAILATARNDRPTTSGRQRRLDGWMS
jgi:hypothetical protein